MENVLIDLVKDVDRLNNFGTSAIEFYK